MFRGDTQILSAKTSEPRFVVPQAWKFTGRRHSIKAARYRWYVWLLDRKRGKLVRRDPVVQATFTIAG